MRPKETPKLVMRLLDEDICRIVEGLKVATEDENTALVVGVKQAISIQNN